MKTPQPKVRILRVSDPDEIESIERDELHDIVGWSDRSGHWAYAFSVERYRKMKALRASQNGRGDDGSE